MIEYELETEMIPHKKHGSRFLNMKLKFTKYPKEWCRPMRYRHSLQSSSYMEIRVSPQSGFDDSLVQLPNNSVAQRASIIVEDYIRRKYPLALNRSIRVFMPGDSCFPNREINMTYERNFTYEQLNNAKCETPEELAKNIEQKIRAWAIYCELRWNHNKYNKELENLEAI